MSKKAIILTIILMLLLCLGMWRYAVLWQAEQTEEDVDLVMLQPAFVAVLHNLELENQYTDFELEK